MRVVAISDTHNKHEELTRPGSKLWLPDGDVIIHAGDFTGMGTEKEVRDSMDWYSSLTQYKHRILIAGNHDFLPYLSESDFRRMVPDNVTYLRDSGVEIDGVKFWGSPWTPPFMDWAFMMERRRLEAIWSSMPMDIDVLITHGPEYGFGDYAKFSDDYVGDVWLGRAISLRPSIKVHIFGHIHEGYGVYTNADEHMAVNASILDERYRPVNQPIAFEV